MLRADVSVSEKITLSVKIFALLTLAKTDVVGHVALLTCAIVMEKSPNTGETWSKSDCRGEFTR
jgi:hypothetical protein